MNSVRVPLHPWALREGARSLPRGGGGRLRWVFRISRGLGREAALLLARMSWQETASAQDANVLLISRALAKRTPPQLHFAKHTRASEPVQHLPFCRMDWPGAASELPAEASPALPLGASSSRNRNALQGHVFRETWGGQPVYLCSS